MTDKDKKQLIVVVVGVGILAFLLLGGNSKKGHGRSRRNPHTTVKSSEIAQAVEQFNSNLKILAEGEVNKSIVDTVEDDKIWGRNPFEFLVSTKPAVKENKEEVANIPEFKINGIIYDEDPDASSVVIEGDFYQAGEVVDGWLIVSIEEDNVIFQKDDIEYIFYLYEQS